MNCSLYGYHPVIEMQALASSNGNQCPIISATTNSYSPCAMERAGRPPDWRICPLNPGLEPKAVFLGFRRVEFARVKA